MYCEGSVSIRKINCKEERISWKGHCQWECHIGLSNRESQWKKEIECLHLTFGYIPLYYGWAYYRS